MIAVGGFKVYPSVIEKHLYEHPAVKEAIVLGVPDAYRGEAPKAFVTIEDGFDVSGEALAAWLNPQLGKHERVNAVEVRLNLPKRSEEHTSELQSLMRISYAVFCLKKKKLQARCVIGTSHNTRENKPPTHLSAHNIRTSPYN